MNRNTHDPNLSEKLTADYVALQNDLQQAKLLAADYHHQLCDKANDLAALKLALKKMAGDLEKLQAHIVELREERHELANEAMRVLALEARLADATNELDRLRAERKREFIELKFEETESLVIIPTEIESSSTRSSLRRVQLGA